MRSPRISRKRAVLLLGVLAAVAVALIVISGGDDPADEGPPIASLRPATLVLDFQPNAVHAGTYVTLMNSYDRAAHVDLRIQTPSSSTDAVKLLRAGRARFAYLDIHDLAIADAKGADLVGVMALVQKPLAAVLAVPDVRRPRDLVGRRAGVTGVPSDNAVLRSIVAGDGGDPDRVRAVTIGFQAVPALLAGRVAGATAFWNVEGVALHAKRPATHEFRVDRYGAPPYPELVLVTTRASLKQDPALVRDTIGALGRGYDAALADPAMAVDALSSAAPGIDPATTRRELAAVTPAFRAPGGRPFGTLDHATLERWADWEVKFGIVSRRPDVDRLFPPVPSA